MRPPPVTDAMVFAAGRGLRMGALSKTTPKPLVAVAGRTMLDRAVDGLLAAGVERVVVNVHHLADQVEAAARARTDVQVAISDERDRLLDTGGGLMRAAAHLRGEAFFTRNSDCFWEEVEPPALARLAGAWSVEHDALLLLARRGDAQGHDGPGDFHLKSDGRLTRRGADPAAEYVYAGAQIMRRSLLEGAPQGPFSLNWCWDKALARGRLFGLVLDATWRHVGDPTALAAARAALEG